jgi:peptidoglycan/LPS O-acetylase OafA/YrhL
LFVRAAIDRLPWFDGDARQDLAIAFIRTGLVALSSIGIAWISWSVFESPILNLKARLDPRSASGVGPDSPDGRPERTSRIMNEQLRSGNSVGPG